MATEAQDPKTLASWEDAFQHPIAAVRGMEKQLRNDIDSNREKLRLLVGASYRDLLGTAESILEMDSQMQSVEAYLGNMGVRCNSRLVDKKVTNLRSWDNTIQNKERYILASQLAVLRGCPEAISRLLKSGGSILQAARILVISRLLHKKISQLSDSPPYLELLKNRLASLRRKLLARIDQQFQKLEATDAVLVETMCAFSLATSSTAVDVIHHFYHIRQSTMSELGKKADGNMGIFRSLRTFVKTLKDAQNIAPAQLARALENLKANPLLQSPDLNSLTELNLDIHQRWLGDDITIFTPYVRHDDLQKPEATRILNRWAKDAFSSFLDDLRSKLSNVENPASILDLRQEMLELWLQSRQLSTPVDVSEVLRGIQEVFIDRLKYLIHQHCARLGGLASTIASILDHWETGISDDCPPMWDNAVTAVATGPGGKVLKEALLARAHGRSRPVQTTTAAYAEWLDGIRDLESVIEKSRKKRWADDLDSLDEDDDVLENSQSLLSEEDPRILQDTLQTAIASNLHKLQDSVRIHADDLQASRDEDHATTGHKACFLLRIWWDIASHLPSSHSNPNLHPNFVNALQSQLSEAVLRQPLLQAEKRLSKTLRQTQLRARVLWEGDPPLPVLPSPQAFRLLHDVVRSMAAFGADVWTPQAVGILKRRIREALAPLLGRLSEGAKPVNGQSPTHDKKSSEQHASTTPDANDEQAVPEKQEGDDVLLQAETREDVEEPLPVDRTAAKVSREPSGGPSEEVARDMAVQRLFDVLYLQHATSVEKGPDAEDALGRIQSVVVEGLDLQSGDVQRMSRGAEAYWKRTELLFALLA
ncbi:MAG: hypothetical protein LQ344_001638 [Seirophora lacunosa]|nr:MAG: hypothetical protein LQ344_001638 [Seirophora lacunosa]